MIARRATSALVVLFALSCTFTSSCARELPPLAEAIVVVDTDMPVPRLASRLRVDVYTQDGKWYESRDVALPDPSSWPASFSLYSPDSESPRVALLRLRVYAEGKVRDYRGERFAARPRGGSPGGRAPSPIEPEDQSPRLLRDGKDITPSSEPQPLLAIDRLVSITFTPGVRGTARIVMHGACAGTMVDLSARKSCIDEENVRADAANLALDPDLGVARASTLAGTFGAVTPCNVEPRASTGVLDEDVCVPGSAFVLGDARTAGSGDVTGAPERIAIIPPLLVDRFEVTVARWRAALAAGFKSPDNTPVRVDETVPARKHCTWSTAPGNLERHALTCMTRLAARAFCIYHGGDLLTEAQVEYVALAAARPVKTRFPWGDESPACARAVWGRDPDATGFQEAECLELGAGPQPADIAAGPGGDVTIGTGIVNLSSGVAEWLQDAFHRLTDNCWAGAPLHDPVCLDETTGDRSLRGTNWAGKGNALAVAVRQRSGEGPINHADVITGFRCARPGRAP